MEERCPHAADIDLTSLVSKGFIIWIKISFLMGQIENPEQVR